MVVYEIDIERFAVIEAEHNPPVGAHGNCPKAFPIAGQRMQLERRHVRRLDGLVPAPQARHPPALFCNVFLWSNTANQPGIAALAAILATAVLRWEAKAISGCMPAAVR